MSIEREVKVLNPQGLHARPASILVKIANKYVSSISVSKGGEKVNGKSIMGIMMLAANQGAVVKLEISGPDEEAAMEDLAEFLMRTEEPGSMEGLT